MNWLLSFYPGDRAMLIMANALAQATAVIMLAWLVGATVARRNAAVRYVLCLAALAVTLVGPVTAVIADRCGLTTFSIAWTVIEPPTESAVGQPAALVGRPGQTERRAQATATDLSAPALPSLQVANSPHAAPVAATVSRPSTITTGQRLREILSAGLLLWAIGSVFLSARLIHGWGVLTSLRQGLRPLEELPYFQILACVRAAVGVKNLPPIMLSTVVGSPITVGLFSPAVVLPEHLPKKLSSAELADVLTHECAHLAQGDHWIGFVQRLVEMVYWPLPLVYFLNRWLATAREDICDNYVLRRSDSRRYAHCLVSLAENTTVFQRMPATVGLAHPRWRMADRIEGLLDSRRKLMTRMNTWVVAGVMIVFLGVGVFVAGCQLKAQSPAGPNDYAAHPMAKDSPVSQPAREPVDAARAKELARVGGLSLLIRLQVVVEKDWWRVEYDLPEDQQLRPPSPRRVWVNMQTGEMITTSNLRKTSEPGPEDIPQLLVGSDMNGRHCAAMVGQDVIVEIDNKDEVGDLNTKWQCDQAKFGPVRLVSQNFEPIYSPTDVQAGAPVVPGVGVYRFTLRVEAVGQADVVMVRKPLLGGPVATKEFRLQIQGRLPGQAAAMSPVDGITTGVRVMEYRRENGHLYALIDLLVPAGVAMSKDSTKLTILIKRAGADGWDISSWSPRGTSEEVALGHFRSVVPITNDAVTARFILRDAGGVLLDQTVPVNPNANVVPQLPSPPDPRLEKIRHADSPELGITWCTEEIRKDPAFAEAYELRATFYADVARSTAKTDAERMGYLNRAAEDRAMATELAIDPRRATTIWPADDGLVIRVGDRLELSQKKIRDGGGKDEVIGDGFWDGGAAAFHVFRMPSGTNITLVTDGKKVLGIEVGKVRQQTVGLGK